MMKGGTYCRFIRDEIEAILMDLIIVGAGSVGGHVALNLAEYNDSLNLIGFVDDDKKRVGKKAFGYEVLGPVDYLLDCKNVAVVVGIAFPKAKGRVLDRLSANRTLTYPTLVSPRAWISAGVEIGNGCIIYPGTAINYGTVVHDFVVLNMNCSIGHDCKIGYCTSLAPGVNLAGHTKIGRSVEMGIGASTRQSVAIHDNAIVGGQAMVVSDLEENAKVVGVPARTF